MVRILIQLISEIAKSILPTLLKEARKPKKTIFAGKSEKVQRSIEDEIEGQLNLGDEHLLRMADTYGLSKSSDCETSGCSNACDGNREASS